MRERVGGMKTSKACVFEDLMDVDPKRLHYSEENLYAQCRQRAPDDAASRACSANYKCGGLGLELGFHGIEIGR